MNQNKNNITEASVIPYNMSWRAGINDPKAFSQGGIMGDPGAAMAKAFVQSLDRKPPKVNIPNPTQSKTDQYWRDVVNYMSPIPTFGVQDDRPETQGELKAKYYSMPINEPAPNSQPGFTFKHSGDVTKLEDMPINGLPNISL